MAIDVTQLRPDLARPSSDAVPLLLQPPQRSYADVALLEARGALGTDLGAIYTALRERAGEVGADAVLVKKQEKRYRDPPGLDTTYGYALGDAYPSALRALDEDAFPAAGSRVKYGGVYYRVQAAAIRYQNR